MTRTTPEAAGIRRRRRALGPGVALAACSFGLLPGTLAADAPDSSTYEEAVVRVVAVSADGKVGTGSGFLVDDRHVVTNQHVVGGEGPGPNPTVSIVLAGGRDWIPVTVFREDETTDLAVLRTAPGQGRSSVALRLDELARGTEVYAVGYPGSADRASGDLLQSTLTNGILSKPPFDAQWGARGAGLARVLQHTAAINPGSSGGPLLDACGSVVGVNTAGGITEIHDASGNVIGETAAQGISLAVHASELSRALDRWNVDFETAGACGAPGLASAGRPGTFQRAWLIALPVLLAAVVGSLLFVRLRHRPLPDAAAMAGDSANAAQAAAAPLAAGRGSAALRLAGSGGAPHLTVRLDDLRAAVHGLSFGRQSDLVDNPLAVDGLSRRHFRIRDEAGRAFVEDLNSTNGTFVNGERLRPYRGRQLRGGDELAAGDARWRVA